MIPNIFVLFSFYLVIIISLIGYGYLFERLFYKEILESNFGYTGLRGIFLLIFYSFLSHFFFAHGYLHNVILTVLGCIFFAFYILKIPKKKEYPLILLVNFFISVNSMNNWTKLNVMKPFGTISMKYFLIEATAMNQVAQNFVKDTLKLLTPLREVRGRGLNVFEYISKYLSYTHIFFVA